MISKTTLLLLIGGANAATIQSKFCGGSYMPVQAQPVCGCAQTQYTTTSCGCGCAPKPTMISIQAPPQQRCYSEKIIQMPQPAPQHTYIQAPAQAPPQVTILNMPPQEKVCCAPVVEKCCPPQFDRIELSDDEEEEPLPPVIIRTPGVEKSEFDLLKDAVFGIKDALIDLEDRMTQNNEVISQNMLTLQSNLKMLDDKMALQDQKISKNTADIRDLRRDMDLMKSDFESMLNEIGAEMEGLGAVEFDGLGALEDQIAEAGGLQIGERWKLRFKEGNNQDFFIQDREKKGYYRFRTTGCDHVVQGVNVAGSSECCC